MVTVHLPPLKLKLELELELLLPLSLLRIKLDSIATNGVSRGFTSIPTCFMFLLRSLIKFN